MEVLVFTLQVTEQGPAGSWLNTVSKTDGDQFDDKDHSIQVIYCGSDQDADSRD